ncbi:SLATT domain-containing protein [Chitinophaga ginsengisoli]|uniref:SMODS and SLOG-associating 2TM effector domain-containing protein n=1 Tax=Chitinophaga ginsengisoli TaxID=363837 RepID=A0A2P8FKZ7_9BACT|nr:SLATT domain-containing protein [Chitinophaga ginsengisoli]PSL22376.1 hypothetical protein CLV42_1222 [Chitinophaga ginsengisoli]
MNEQTRKLILDWMRKIHILEYANRSESIRWKNIHFWLGVPALVLGVLIAAVPKLDFFADAVSTVLTLGGLLIAILTGLQTFLKSSEKSESFRKMSVRYEELRHKIEVLLQTDTEKEAQAGLEKIRKEWAAIDSINVSQNHFNRAKGKVKKFGKYPEELSFLENI